MSKMTTCKSCKKDISKGAKCPNCGKDSRNFFMKHKILTGILALIVIGVVSTAMSPKSDISKVDGEAKETSSAKKEDNRNFEVGETANKKDKYNITVNSLSNYTSANEFMKAKDGFKYVIADITVENLGKKDDIAVSSIISFKLLNLEGVTYDIAITDAGSQIDGTVAPGRKLTGTISYEVPEDLTEAELEVKLNIIVGKAIYFKGTIQ